MTAEIKNFPTSRNIGIVDQVTFGCAERFDQQEACIGYFDECLNDLIKSKLDMGVSESDVRADMYELIHTVTEHTYNLFGLELSTRGFGAPIPDAG